MTTKIKFFSADNWRKYGWVIIGFISISLLTSAGMRISTISDGAKLGRQAFDDNKVQDLKLCNHEERLVKLEQVSVVVIEKISGLDKKITDSNEALNKRLDDIYKILLTK